MPSPPFQRKKRVSLSPSSHSPADPVACCHQCGTQHTCIKEKKPPWRRILWERQPYADNYVDQSFLSSLVTNANLRKPRFWTTSLATMALIQRLAVLVILALIFFMTLNEELPVEDLIMLDLILVFAGLVMTLTVKSHFQQQDLQACFNKWHFTVIQGKRLLIFAGILYWFSPVLQTLTSSYSSDTIWALTIGLTALHTASHDYSYINDRVQHHRKQDGAVSLNTGIFASILLASRLSCPRTVFGFMFLAFEAMAGFPIIAKQIYRFGVRLHLGFTMLLALIATWLLLPLSKVLVGSFLCSIVVIALICPFWLMWIQRFKNQIQGSWDYDDEDECKTGNL